MYIQPNMNMAFVSIMSPIGYLAGDFALIEGTIRPYYRKDIYPCTNLNLFKRAEAARCRSTVRKLSKGSKGRGSKGVIPTSEGGEESVIAAVISCNLCVALTLRHLLPISACCYDTTRTGDPEQAYFGTRCVVLLNDSRTSNVPILAVSCPLP